SAGLADRLDQVPPNRILAQMRGQFHERIESRSAATIWEIEHSGVAHLRMRLERCFDRRCVGCNSFAASLRINKSEQTARDQDVDALSGCHPNPRCQSLAADHAPFRRRERFGNIASLVLEKVTQIFVCGDTE